MQTERPLILISNDDGYYLPGIHALVDMVSDLSDVLVCTPEAACSGFSYAFSAVEYLRLKRRKNIGTAQVWSCSGTPIDCVRLALGQLYPNRRSALILGGINRGDNSSVDSHCSGTMDIAMEGCMKYVPSVTLSSCYHEEDTNLEPLRPYVRMVMKKVLADGLPKGICLNVSFPTRQAFEGIKAYRMTMGRWVNEIVKQHHPHQHDCYRAVGEYRNDEPNTEDPNQWALNHGYVAITSIKIGVTAYEFMDEIREWEKPVAPSAFSAQN